jgi:cysteine synthase A
LQHNLLKKGFDIMTKIYRSLTDLIGNTPLLELTNYNRKFAPQATIIAKLEYFNPAGSAKGENAQNAPNSQSRRNAQPGSASRPARTDQR